MNIRQSVAAATIILSSGLTQASSQHGTYPLPAGFAEARLLESNNSRLQWHIYNEACKAALFSVSLGAGLLTAQLFKSPWLKMGVNASLDYVTAEDWYDFSWRQALRASLIATTLASKAAEPYQPWLKGLGYIIPELNNLRHAVTEALKQPKRYHQHSLQGAIQLGSHGQYDYYFYTTNSPAHLLSLYRIGRSHAPSPSTDPVLQENLPLAHSVLQQLIHLMANNDVSHINLQPRVLPDTLTLGIRIRRHNSPPENHTLQTGLLAPDMPWITAYLNSNTPRQGDSKAYTPLTPCLVKTLQQILNKEPLSHTQFCLPHTVTATGTQSLQLVPLDKEAYILLDHGVSQGTRTPDLWIAATSAHEAAASLAALEERLIPGPEVGYWRLLTTARSLAHQLFANLAMDYWLSSPEKANENPGKNKEAVKVLAPETSTSHESITEEPTTQESTISGWEASLHSSTRENEFDGVTYDTREINDSSPPAAHRNSTSPMPAPETVRTPELRLLPELPTPKSYIFTPFTFNPFGTFRGLGTPPDTTNNTQQTKLCFSKYFAYKIQGSKIIQEPKDPLGKGLLNILTAPPTHAPRQPILQESGGSPEVTNIVPITFVKARQN